MCTVVGHLILTDYVGPSCYRAFYSCPAHPRKNVDRFSVEGAEEVNSRALVRVGSWGVASSLLAGVAQRKRQAV